MITYFNKYIIAENRSEIKNFTLIFNTYFRA